MYGNLALVEMAFSLILFLATWLTIRQASQLRRSGSMERLHRKSRKLLLRTGWLTLPALVVFVCIGLMMSSLPSLFWEDRLLLNAPLIGAPLLAVWFTTVPMLWSLWKTSARTNGTLNAQVRNHLCSRLFLLPYQATALGAATSFYCTLISPVPYDKLKVVAPLTVYVLVMIGLWLHHDRRIARLRDWIRGSEEDIPMQLQESQAETRTRA